jgi:hypothetical protein
MKSPRRFRLHVNRMMKTKSLFVFLMILLLSACSAGQAAPINIPVQATEPVAPLAAQATVDSDVEATEVSATEPVLPTATFAPKPPLEQGAWMHMPAVPTEISDAMRAVYERGLILGNDPNRFSVIGDCQKSSAWARSMLISSRRSITTEAPSRARVWL